MTESPHPNHSETTASAIASPLVLADFLARCMGNTAVATHVLDAFEQQMTTDLRHLGERLAAKDAGQIARTAHALKGSAGSAAATTLQHLAARVEVLARQDLLDSIAHELVALRTEVERCIAYLPTARRELKSVAANEPASESTQ